MPDREFPRISESEMISAGGGYFPYLLGIVLIGFIGGALFASGEEGAWLCGICTISFTVVCGVGLQYKIIADSVAAGMVMFDQSKVPQESQESAPEPASEPEPEPKPTPPPEYVRSWRKKHKSKVEEKISKISDELKILRPMLDLAISTQDTQTKDNLRPRIEALLKNLNNLRSELPLLEEE